jgi:hypothetical protein
MKTIKFNRHISFCFVLFFGISVNAQQPYKINPANGLPVLDLNNNPLKDDRNYISTPVFSEEFLNPGVPPNINFPFHYGSNLHSKELAYVVLEDPSEDNCSNNCTGCNSNNFFGTQIQYPIGHIYQIANNTSTVKLITQKYSQDFIRGWYKDGTCSWGQKPKRFTYTTGQLISKNAFKYGYFEARFKINRPPGASNTGIGQCFWMFPPQIIPGYTKQYCYSEIDIAENQPEIGLHAFGAIVSKYDVPSNENCPINGSLEVTGECNCSTCYPPPNQEYIAKFHPFVEQDQFHTYALEWTPTSFKFFYDNRLLHTINNIGTQGKTPTNFDPMNIILDIEAADEINYFHSRCKYIDTNLTQFPFEFEIDYVHQYKLDLTQCNVILPTIYNQTAFNNFTNNPIVKSEIKIGEENSYYPIVVSSGMNVSLRAANIIELHEGFEVTEEGEFFADVIGGCDAGY